MKQVIEMKIVFEIDYSNPKLAQMAKEKMEKENMTDEQMRAEVRDMIVEGMTELVDGDFQGDGLPGLTYKVEAA